MTRARILCVDDDRNILRALSRVFMDDDLEIITAQSAQEGLAVLEDGPPVQVVLSDYRMPGMNGVDFLRQVRDRWRDKVRIVMSGYADTGSVVEAINEGQIYKFIAKPWCDDDLRATVGKAVELYGLHQEYGRLWEVTRDSGGCGAIFCPGTLVDHIPLALVAVDEGGEVFAANWRANDRAKALGAGADKRDPRAYLPEEAVLLMDRLRAGEEGPLHEEWHAGESWTFRFPVKSGCWRTAVLYREKECHE